MAVEQFRGILAAVVTPFTADGSALDEAGIARQVEHILGNGVHGLVPGGSTGESSSLTLEERKRSAALYIEAAAGRGPVIVGAGALTTAETIELARHADAAGASGVMVVPPFYDALSFEELLAHYRAVSDAIDIPIMYYHLPSTTGVDLTADQFAELAAKTRVSCFKSTSDNAVKLTEIMQTQSDVIQPINGYDTLTFFGLAAGAKASVWGAASVIPGLAAELYQALAVDDDIVKGRELWARIWPICDFMEQHNYAAVIKAGVELVGVPAGPARLPVQPIAPQYIEQYRRLLTAAGVDLA